MIISRFATMLMTVLAASCASDSGDSSSGPEPVKPLSQRLNESNGYKQDTKGNWVPKSDKRSSFESMGESTNFKGEFSGKTYKAGEYSKKSWWGNKDFGRKEYSGATDGSRFQKKSRFNDQNSSESTGDTAMIADPYQTGGYSTSSAREAGNSKFSRPSDAETDSRRRAYQQPDIIHWKQQRSITLDQSRGILGR